jgi:hypothetical protein
MKELLANGEIRAEPTNVMTYMIDGSVLQLPLAKSIRNYKERHWLPVVFNIKGKQT